MVLMRELDPEGVHHRASRRLRRRVYINHVRQVSQLWLLYKIIIATFRVLTKFGT